MKKYYFAIIALILGAICLFAFKVIGSDVSPDGKLLEPFFLLPIGYLFLFTGILSAIIILVRARVKK